MTISIHEHDGLEVCENGLETFLETYCTLISEEIIHSLRATTSQKKINVSI